MRRSGALKRSLWLAGATLVMLVGACNNHPVEPLDAVVTAGSRSESRLPAKTKLDFVFVIDNSGSMCQEQENLTRNFRLISDFLFDDLRAAADYRIVIVSTDMANHGGAEREHRGRFLRKPARALPQPNCLDQDGLPKAPATEDCFEPGPPATAEIWGELPTIIMSGRDGNIGQNCDDAENPIACAKQDLERKFRCLSTLGVGGSGYEMGLESVRYALSCNGPNVDSFGSCCVLDNPSNPNSRKHYNAGCTIRPGEEEPDFLRPDAVLIVTFISDENDCSDPEANPAESNLVICKYDPIDENPADGVPDGYADPSMCAGMTPAECFENECGNLPVAQCKEARCLINKDANEHCEWDRDKLVPVRDYYRFLAGLKAQPAKQLMVATVVGHRIYTESLHELTYNRGTPPEGCDLDRCRAIFDSDVFTCESGDDACLEGAALDRADCEESVNNMPVDVCCPSGQCRTKPQPSCSSEGNGEAFVGRRYLQLAEMFNSDSEGNGIGCAPGNEPGFCGFAYSGNIEEMERCEDNADTCVNICVEDFTDPLRIIKNRIVELIGTFCLEKVPACVVRGEDGAADIACVTADEFSNGDNYQIRIRMQCTRTAAEGGLCEVPMAPRSLARDEWIFEADVAGCSGGALVKLVTPPPAGAEVFIEFLVAVGGARPPSGGDDAGLGPAADASVGEDAAVE